MSGWYSTGQSSGPSWRALPVQLSETPQLQSLGSAASPRQVTVSFAVSLL